MCGIYGIVTLDGRAPGTGAIARMARVTVHRGPDDEGRFEDGPLAFGMRRLSIIDVAGGHQPIANEDESVWAICNGEIYNFRQLRTALEAQGHRFRTRSDTEVLVHLYEEHGEGFVERLDGMYGFALWDMRRRRLLIGRDRLGIKPIYLARETSRWLFASEAKAILAVRETAPRIDRVALREYLSLGYVPSPLSLFEGIEKLEPGTLVTLDADSGALHRTRFWQPRAPAPVPTARDWVAETRAQLESSVEAQMVSDVPLGAFLSGGIDSSAVVAMMARHSAQPVKTYSIGFEAEGAGALYNELEHARRVAKRFGTDHHEIIVRPDVATLLPKLLWHMDEPVADSAFITTHLVSELAAKDVKVILSGVGGDELFGGYRRYLGAYLDRWYRLVPGVIRRNVLGPIARRLPSDRHGFALNLARYAKSYILSQDLDEASRYRSYVGVFPDSGLDALLRDSTPRRDDTFTSLFAALDSTDPVGRLMEADLRTQLPDDLLLLTDRMTMASSIECRVPLIDQALVDLALAMPSSLKVRGRELKHVLKRALSDVLPREILHRSKRGFGAPMGAWLKQSLTGMTSALLAPAALESRGWFRPEAVARLVDEHRRSAADHSDHLQCLVNLEIFCRIYLDNRTPCDVADELREMCA